MIKKQLTVVLSNSQDALRFLDEKPKVDRVLALTPNARALVLEQGTPILNTLDLYTDYSHLRTIARVRRAERFFFELLNNEQNLSTPTKEMLRGKFHPIASASVRLWLTVGKSGPWLIPTNGKWEEINDRFELYVKLLPILEKYRAHNKRPKTWFSGTVRLLTTLAATNYARFTPILVNNYSYGTSFLSNLMAESEPPIRSFQIIPSKGKYYDLLISIRSLWRSLLGSTTNVFAATSQATDSLDRILNSLVSKVQDSVIRHGLEASISFFYKDTIFYSSLKKDIKNIITNAKPKKVLFNHIKFDHSVYIGELAGKLNIHRILISHGSHTKTNTAAGQYEQKDLARGVFVSPLIDETILQSPHAEELSKELNINYGQAFHPIMWGYKKANDSTNSKEFNILHTGTYKTWLNTRPWMFETDDEFIFGLTLLINATRNISNIKLVIRVRPLPGCSIDTLKKLLPEGEHYKIKTSGQFLDDLSKANLLVSWASTTMEEAINARKPVLLLGGSTRYQHIKAKTSVPTPNDRAPIYAISNELDTIQMIKSIIQSHAKKPLTDEELCGYKWPNTIPGISEFIKYLAH